MTEPGCFFSKIVVTHHKWTIYQPIEPGRWPRRGRRCYCRNPSLNIVMAYYSCAARSIEAHSCNPRGVWWCWWTSHGWAYRGRSNFLWGVSWEAEFAVGDVEGESKWETEEKVKTYVLDKNVNICRRISSGSNCKGRMWRLTTNHAHGFGVCVVD